MADTKPVETAPAAEPVVETKPAEETAAAPAATDAAAAEAAAPAETTEAPAAVADATKKEEDEAKPIEEGSLSHKGEGANFPKNLIHSKKFFWFGSDAVDLKTVSTFKADKVTDVAHHITSWAAETGKGLFFYGEKDKSAPQGAIHLAEASEPEKEGTNKFTLSANGHKHSFKAVSATERDRWMAQLKVKIAEAKDLATSVTESETYKKTLEALKPAPAKKEDKAPAAEATPEAPAETAEPAAATATETPAAEAAKDQEAKEEPEKEEPKRRSASRKRTSIFGSLLGKKEDKKTEAATEPEATAEPSAVAEAATETPAPAPEAAAATAATETPEETKEEKKEEATAAADAKPVPVKRGSLFGNLPFGKKKAVSPEPTPATEEAPATEAVAETAPVIPAVETTEPLTTDVTPAAAASSESADAPAATNGETKKEVKSDKRKSSLPFVGAFLTKDKATSGDEAEKPKSPSPFSKLRATIKGKKSEKADDKADDKTEETPAPIAEAEGEAAEEAAKPAEAEAAPATEEPAKPVQATPAVTAAA